MDLQAIGARVQAARKAAHMSQEDLAEKVLLSRTHVSVIERGVKSPSLETFVLIANALGVSADALLFDVVDNAAQERASELSAMLDGLAPKERRRILRAVRALLEDE